jgi:hypothetical protein
MNRTFRGITIESSDESKDTNDFICVNRDFDSSKIDESDWQYEKHEKQRISTLSGIKTDLTDECENSDYSIRVNREFDSNEIEWRRLRPSKSFGAMIEIDSEIQTRTAPAESSEQKQNIPIRLSTEPLRTTSRCS